MKIDIVNKLLGGSLEDVHVALSIIAAEIHKQPNMEFAYPAPFEGGNFIELKAFPIPIREWPTSPVPIGIAYRDFSLNMGGYYIVYAKPDSHVYTAVLRVNNDRIVDI